MRKRMAAVVMLAAMTAVAAGVGHAAEHDFQRGAGEALGEVSPIQAATPESATALQTGS